MTGYSDIPNDCAASRRVDRVARSSGTKKATPVNRHGRTPIHKTQIRNMGERSVRGRKLVQMAENDDSRYDSHHNHAKKPYRRVSKRLRRMDNSKGVGHIDAGPMACSEDEVPPIGEVNVVEVAESSGEDDVEDANNDIMMPSHYDEVSRGSIIYEDDEGMDQSAKHPSQGNVLSLKMAVRSSKSQGSQSPNCSHRPNMRREPDGLQAVRKDGAVENPMNGGTGSNHMFLPVVSPRESRREKTTAPPLDATMNKSTLPRQNGSPHRELGIAQSPLQRQKHSLAIENSRKESRVSFPAPQDVQDGADAEDDREEVETSLFPTTSPTSALMRVEPAETSSHGRGQLASLHEAMTCMTNMMREEFAALQRNFQKAQVQTQTVNTKLRTEVAELRLMVATSDVLKKKNRSDRQEQLDASLVLFEVVFCDSLIQMAVETCTIGHVTTFLQDTSERDYGHRAADAIRVMHFARQRKDTKDRFNSNIGQCYSRFRRGVVLTTLKAAQDNILRTFRSRYDANDKNGDGPTDGTYTDSRRADVKPELPSWAQPGFVRFEHVERSRRGIEEVNQHKTKKKPSDSVKDELSDHAADRLYSLIRSRFHACRDTARLGIFNEFGYIFADWSKTPLDDGAVVVDQDTMKFEWFSEDTSGLNIDLKTVPVLRTRMSTSWRTSDPLIKMSELESENQSILSTFLGRHQEMLLHVTHDVFVLRDKRGKRNEGRSGGSADGMEFEENLGELKQIHRVFNLFDIACRYLASYTGFSQYRSPKHVLSSHPNSLRAVFGIAALLREITAIFVAKSREFGVREGLRSHRNDIGVHSVRIDDLLPPLSKREGPLKRSGIQLTKQAYERLHFTETPADMLQTNSGDRQDQAMFSERNGVFSLHQGENVET